MSNRFHRWKGDQVYFWLLENDVHGVQGFKLIPLVVITGKGKWNELYKITLFVNDK